MISDADLKTLKKRRDHLAKRIEGHPELTYDIKECTALTHVLNHFEHEDLWS